MPCYGKENKTIVDERNDGGGRYKRLPLSADTVIGWSNTGPFNSKNESRGCGRNSQPQGCKESNYPWVPAEHGSSTEVEKERCGCDWEKEKDGQAFVNPVTRMNRCRWGKIRGIQYKIVLETFGSLWKTVVDITNAKEHIL